MCFQMTTLILGDVRLGATKLLFDVTCWSPSDVCTDSMYRKGSSQRMQDGKKKEYIKCLENRVAVLENQNKALIDELKSLKELFANRKPTNFPVLCKISLF
ncbi:hypothetical protein LSTR_LSTR013014 [Laodelphax striatellus]|uniref:BZIP domain-containing protein n=1 Tax=Laodelphax striatellus TaxID=195883 RepID=A0A482XJ26_LAOST|nr:hypothetical protein LSTR_LSTR013014 [Laodelphax striatellus]